MTAATHMMVNRQFKGHKSFQGRVGVGNNVFIKFYKGTSCVQKYNMMFCAKNASII